MAYSPRLFLITPPVADAPSFAPLLSAALSAADVACVLLRIAARDEHGIKAVVRVLAPIVQRSDAAVLVEQEARLAARLDVDGVHVMGAGLLFEEALGALKPNKIVGVGGLDGRDAAMAAGEAGADYLMFGAPEDAGAAAAPHDSVLGLVAWWAEIFNVPCVGYVRHPERAGEIAAAGAEFIGLCDGLWEHPEAIVATLTAVSKAIVPLTENVP